MAESVQYFIIGSYIKYLPKKIADDEKQKKLIQSKLILASTKEHLASVRQTLQDLQANFQAAQSRKADLMESVGRTKSRLQRAQKIMS